jgi:hypothetical protein
MSVPATSYRVAEASQVHDGDEIGTCVRLMGWKGECEEVRFCCYGSRRSLGIEHRTVNQFFNVVQLFLRDRTEVLDFQEGALDQRVR